MKKKTLIIIAVIVLLCLVGILAGSVLAKYISVLQANGEAQIAKWSFENDFKNNGEAVTNSQIQLQNTYNKESLVNGKIAPGTSGDFSIEIDARGSEVALEYMVKFKEKEGKEEKPSNLKFSLDDGRTYVSTLSELEAQMHDTINADAENKVKEYKVSWKWAYETEPKEQNDQLDTQDAIKLNDYAFDITITGFQLDPQN